MMLSITSLVLYVIAFCAAIKGDTAAAFGCLIMGQLYRMQYESKCEQCRRQR
jgi:hypothetical protein